MSAPLAVLNQLLSLSPSVRASAASTIAEIIVGSKSSGLSHFCLAFLSQGGIYMGGDYVKHSFTLAASMMTLAWSLLHFGPAYQQVCVCRTGRAPALKATEASGNTWDVGVKTGMRVCARRCL